MRPAQKWTPDRTLIFLCVTPGTNPSGPVRLSSLGQAPCKCPFCYITFAISITCCSTQSYTCPSFHVGNSGLWSQKCQSNQRGSEVPQKGRRQTHLQERQKENWENDRLVSLRLSLGGDGPHSPAAICRQLKDMERIAEPRWAGERKACCAHGVMQSPRHGLLWCPYSGLVRSGMKMWML